MPMEALLSSFRSSQFWAFERSPETFTLSGGREDAQQKTQFLKIRDPVAAAAAETGKPSSSARIIMNCGLAPVSDLVVRQPGGGPAQTVAEPLERVGLVFFRRSLLALPLAAATIALSPPSSAAIKVENRAPSTNPLFRSFGLGEHDIYYPRFFQGTWNCYSTLIAVETPQGEDKVDLKSVEQSRRRLGYTTTYQARFLPFEGYVVCDRLFTTVSLVESVIGKNTVEHGAWNPRQPNRLELFLKGGPKVENTVTKRSSGMFSANEFESAEFSKQVLDNFSTRDGPPTVKASQNLTRYQWDSAVDEVSKIEAIQKVSMFAVPKEGQNFEGFELFDTTNPITIYKYKVTFERLAS